MTFAPDQHDKVRPLLIEVARLVGADVDDDPAMIALGVLSRFLAEVHALKSSVDFELRAMDGKIRELSIRDAKDGHLMLVMMWRPDGTRSDYRSTDPNADDGTGGEETSGK